MRAGRKRRSISTSVSRMSVAEEHIEDERIAHSDDQRSTQGPLPTPDPDVYKRLALPSTASDLVASRAVLPNREKARCAAVHAATHVDDKDCPGPGINDSEVLQHIFAKIDDPSESSDEYSSDSDIGRNRKRSSISIVPGSLESYQLARRFTGGSDNSNRLQGVEE